MVRNHSRQVACDSRNHPSGIAPDDALRRVKQKTRREEIPAGSL